MKRLIFPTFILLQFFCYGGNQPEGKNYLGIPVPEIENSVKSHLSCWLPRIIDTINGGYYTNFESDWTRSNNQERMIVTQSRDLWTASKAAGLFPDSCLYKQYAEHGFKFLINNLWDDEKGGFHIYYSPIYPDKHENYKIIYGNAFALYAMAEYAKINPSEEVFLWINKTFRWIDSVAHDNVNGGYFNTALDEILKKENRKNRKFIKRQGWGETGWKGQNTSIHILEAFTAVYQVMPDPLIRERLEEMLKLVRDTIVQPDSCLAIFLTSDWHPIDNSEKAPKYIMKNIYDDHISFGHNIETAFLITEASEALYGKPDPPSLMVAKKLTDHTLKYGFDNNYYGLFEKGYKFNKKIEIVDRNKTWWSQFEALHTLALMSLYFPKEEIYPLAFYKMWRYINRELYDHENGGYYNNGIDSNPDDKNAGKAHQWKGPYHDGRALMQIWSYAVNP